MNSASVLEIVETEDGQRFARVVEEQDFMRWLLENFSEPGYVM